MTVDCIFNKPCKI